MVVRIDESHDSINVYVDDEPIASWSHEETHENLFRELFEALGVEYEYDEVY